MLRAHNIEKSFGTLKVLKGIDLEIKKGEIVSIVGASGAGKTTLLTILGTLDRLDQGEIFFEGENPMKYNERKLSEFRNKNIGFVFQFHHLLPEFTALENICIPAYINRQSRKNAEKRAYELLKLLNLENRAHHKPAELSGGEQQRVAVARALINNPMIIFADEPTGNLDSVHAIELHNLFFELREKLQQTFVIVTHNESFANMTDRRLVIKDGVIIS